jgi:hypothetical protein
VSTDLMEAWYRRNFVDVERVERGKSRARIPSAFWAARRMCVVNVRVGVNRGPK